MITVLLAVAIWRVTRLLVSDAFPPVRWLREWTIRTFATVDPAGQIVPRQRGGRPRWVMSLWVLGCALAGSAVTLRVVNDAPRPVLIAVSAAAVALLVGYLAAVWPAVGYAVAYLWTCMWCMSVWAGTAVVFLTTIWVSVPAPWLVVAAGSGLAGVLGWVEQEHDQRWAARDAAARRGQ